MDIKFRCTHCGQDLVIEAAGAGQAVVCSTCNQSLTVPSFTATHSQEETLSGTAGADLVIVIPSRKQNPGQRTAPKSRHAGGDADDDLRAMYETERAERAAFTEREEVRGVDERFYQEERKRAEQDSTSFHTQSVHRKAAANPEKPYQNTRLPFKIGFSQIATIFCILALMRFCHGQFPEKITDPTPAHSQSTNASQREVNFVASALRAPFHRRGCEWAQKIESQNLQKYSTRADAIAAKHVACRVCRP